MTIENQATVGVAGAWRDRAATAGALTGAALRVIWTQARRLRRAWWAARTRVQLHALSDRTLKDIGLSRSDIDSLIR